MGLYKYAYGVACACVWAVDKYVGVMRRLVCSRRIASASERRGWGVGRSSGCVVCAEFILFCDEVGSFFYNSYIQNSKTVMTGEAVDKLLISCG